MAGIHYLRWLEAEVVSEIDADAYLNATISPAPFKRMKKSVEVPSIETLPGRQRSSSPRKSSRSTRQRGKMKSSSPSRRRRR